jgi:hypothetical protein
MKSFYQVILSSDRNKHTLKSCYDRLLRSLATIVCYDCFLRSFVTIACYDSSTNSKSANKLNFDENQRKSAKHTFFSDFFNRSTTTFIFLCYYYYYISYSLCHRLKSTHTKVAIYDMYERKIFWEIKISFCFFVV